MSKIEFTVIVNGKQYNCSREIIGQRVFYQTVYVDGVGQKVDSAAYGKGHHPVQSMDSIAKIIAGEIIRSSNEK